MINALRVLIIFLLGAVSVCSLKVGIKIGAQYILPGGGPAIVDGVSMIVNFCAGNAVGAAFDGASMCFNLATLGGSTVVEAAKTVKDATEDIASTTAQQAVLAASAKDVSKEATKGAWKSAAKKILTLGFWNDKSTVAEAARVATKQATKNIGDAAAKEIASGAAKQAIVDEAKRKALESSQVITYIAAKKLSKEVGQKTAAEISKNTVKIAALRVSKATAEKMMVDAAAKEGVNIAGNTALEYTKAFGDSIAGSVAESVAANAGKGLTKESLDHVVKEGAKAGTKAGLSSVTDEAVKTTLDAAKNGAGGFFSWSAFGAFGAELDTNHEEEHLYIQFNNASALNNEAFLETLAEVDPQYFHAEVAINWQSIIPGAVYKLKIIPCAENRVQQGLSMVFMEITAAVVIVFMIVTRVVAMISG
jgi:hypothetical protein